MKYCSIHGCYSHRLPRHVQKFRLIDRGKLTKEWIRLILTLNYQNVDVESEDPEAFVICEMHFEKKFLIPGGISPEAVPTIYPKKYFYIIKENDGFYDSTLINDIDSFASKILQVYQDRPARTYNTCAVPQCESERGVTEAVSFFQIPKYVRNSPVIMEKWSQILCTYIPDSKCFLVCSLHFHKDELRRSAYTGQRKDSYAMVFKAQPTCNLPTPKPLSSKLSKLQLERAVSFARRLSSEPKHVKHNYTELSSGKECCERNLNQMVFLKSLYETDEKLYAMTGMYDKKYVHALVKECIFLGGDEVTKKMRIVLTMCRLKSNLGFQMLSQLFGIDFNIAVSYFADTIKCLAKVFKFFINSSPNHDNSSKAYRKITLGTDPKLEVVIGVSSSGLINYISPMSEVGIEMVMPETHVEPCKVSFAHIESKIERLKYFKFFSEDIDASLVPFIDDILIVLCGYVNKTEIFSRKTKNSYVDVNSGDIMKNQISTPISEFCGVPCCQTERFNTNEIHIFRIPKYVHDDPELLHKWAMAIGVEPPYPKNFFICSLHFQKDEIVFYVFENQISSRLHFNAIPSKNLPITKNTSKHKLKEVTSFGQERVSEDNKALSDKSEAEAVKTLPKRARIQYIYKKR